MKDFSHFQKVGVHIHAGGGTVFWQERLYLSGDYDLNFFFRSLIFLQIKWKTIGFKMRP